MSKKMRFYHYWDFKSILYTFLTTTLFIVFFEFILTYPGIVKYIKDQSHDQSITGQLISVVPQKHISHSRMGSKLRTGHFLVSFTYEVAGEKYTGQELVLSGGTVKYQLSKILKSENKKVTIKYKKENPANSILALE